VALDRSFGIASCAPALIPTYGAHQFRHGLATELLRQGASLGEIGELLGHRSPETTKIYIKVDLDALRTLALPWPGGVR
jgi:site-specific recombinase XerD